MTKFCLRRKGLPLPHKMLDVTGLVKKTSYEKLRFWCNERMVSKKMSVKYFLSYRDTKVNPLNPISKIFLNNPLGSFLNQNWIVIANHSSFSFFLLQ